MGTSWLFFSCMVTLTRLLTTAALDNSNVGSLLDVQDLKVGVPVTFRSLDGLSFPGPGGELIFCTRTRIPGRSRITNAHKFAHSVHLKIQQDEVPYNAQVYACLQRNASLGLCECSKESWKPLQMGSWTASRSPFETLYLDVKTVDSYTTSFKVTATEELHFSQLVFLLSGLAILLVSESLSSWVPFYYSSAMTLGVLLVILILLYQGMKLLPTGRKSTLYILIYGSLVGVGSVILHYVAGLISSALIQLGLGEDMFNPVAGFLIMGIVVMGAWLGYWGVRKLVLAEDGRVDIGTAQFVKWALRLVGATMLLQGSRDDVFSVLLMALGGAACWASGHFNLGDVRAWKLFKFKRPHFHMSSFTPVYSKKRSQSEFLHKVWSQTSILRSPKASPPGPVFGSPKTPVTRPSISKNQDFYSTFHNTPTRKSLSTEEWEELSRNCTQDALKDLVGSPDFARWAVSQSDRIIVTPTEPREERPEEEIEKTAFMEEAIATPPLTTRRRFPR